MVRDLHLLHLFHGHFAEHLYCLLRVGVVVVFQEPAQEVEALDAGDVVLLGDAVYAQHFDKTENLLVGVAVEEVVDGALRDLVHFAEEVLVELLEDLAPFLDLLVELLNVVEERALDFVLRLVFVGRRVE